MHEYTRIRYMHEFLDLRYAAVPGRNRTLLRSTSVKGGTHMRYVDLPGIDAALLRV